MGPLRPARRSRQAQRFTAGFSRWRCGFWSPLPQALPPPPPPSSLRRQASLPPAPCRRRRHPFPRISPMPALNGTAQAIPSSSRKQKRLCLRHALTPAKTGSSATARRTATPSTAQRAPVPGAARPNLPEGPPVLPFLAVSAGRPGAASPSSPSLPPCSTHSAPSGRPRVSPACQNRHRQGLFPHARTPQASRMAPFHGFRTVPAAGPSRTA